MALMRFTKTADELEDAIDGVLQESADAAARAREHIARVFGTLEEEEALLDLEMEELDFELRYGRQRRRKAREASVGEGSADSNGAPLSLIESPADEADTASSDAASAAAAAATAATGAPGSAQSELDKLLSTIPGLGPAPTLDELREECVARFAAADAPLRCAARSPGALTSRPPLPSFCSARLLVSRFTQVAEGDEEHGAHSVRPRRVSRDGRRDARPCAQNGQARGR
jgi:hypothetical protein